MLLLLPFPSDKYYRQTDPYYTVVLVQVPVVYQPSETKNKMSTTTPSTCSIWVVASIGVKSYADSTPIDKQHDIRLVGSTPNLGEWDPENGVCLHFDPKTCTFQCKLHGQDFGGAGCRPIQCKLVIRPSSHSSSSSSTQSHTAEWTWQRGDNITVDLKDLPVTQDEQDSTVRLLTLDWQGNRQGDDMVESDPYLEPFRENLKTRFQM